MQKNLWLYCVMSLWCVAEASGASPRLLRSGTYHKDEVTDFEASGAWTGLVKDSEAKFTAKTVTVKMARVHDVMLGEGPVPGDENGAAQAGKAESAGEATAVEVTTDANVEFLLRGVKVPLNKPLVTAEIKQESLKPGESLEFTVGGKTGKLRASGELKTMAGQMDMLTNYKWEYEIDGKTQEIAAAEGLDDTNFKILFVGDLNEDKLPDFIVDTSDHYNLTELKLFLSQKKGKEPLKLVTTLTATGC